LLITRRTLSQQLVHKDGWLECNWIFAVCAERERDLCLPLFLCTAYFPPRAHNSRLTAKRRDLESSNANLLCNAYSCRLARSCSKPQQLLRVCTVDTCSFSRVYPKPFSNGPLRAEYSFSLYVPDG
jgi:hypothetical protein